MGVTFTKALMEACTARKCGSLALMKASSVEAVKASMEAMKACVGAVEASMEEMEASMEAFMNLHVKFR